MSKIKIASLFAGVGGIDLGFQQTKKFKTVYANEIDEKASETFNLNNSIEVDNRDIRDINPNEVPDFDVLLAGFPCQPFSVAGYRKGIEDEKNGDLFFEILRFVKVKKPKVVFLENVKNLVGHDNGNTFKIIVESLEQYGYYLSTQVLNACEYGNIPQNRERIYIVAFKEFENSFIFNFPNAIELNTTLYDLIDFDNKVDSKYYYTAEKFKHYDLLKENITSNKTIYQWRRKYVRENKSNLVPTLTANMGTGGHNVPLILSKHGIRKLTPRETFNIQGFPKDFMLPDQANSHLYKQAGNSVVVPVIKRIADQIALVMTLDKNNKTINELSRLVEKNKEEKNYENDTSRKIDIS